MKKFYKVLIVIFIWVLIFLIADYTFAYISHYVSIHKVKKQVVELNANKNDAEEEKYWNIPFYHTLRTFPFEDHYKKTFKDPERIYGVGKGYTKSPIIVLGCSLPEGAFLSYEEKFEGQLSKLSKRMVYNLGYGGMGPSAALMIASDPEVYEYIDSTANKDPEYAVYIYIRGHELRIYNNKYILLNAGQYKVSYNQRDGKLVPGNTFISFLTKFAIFKCIFSNYFAKNLNYTHGPLIKKYFYQTREELQKRYPNIKFVIMVHPVDKFSRHYNNPISPEMWQELKDAGFIIYDLDDYMDVDIADDEYVFPDRHPNAKCWELVVPQFMKDLKL